MVAASRRDGVDGAPFRGSVQCRGLLYGTASALEVKAGCSLRDRGRKV